MDSFPSRLLITLILVIFIVLMNIALAAVDNSSEARLTKLKDEGNKNAQKALKKLEKEIALHNSIKISVVFFELVSAIFVSSLIKSVIIVQGIQKNYPLAIFVGILIYAFVLELFAIYFPQKLTAKSPEKMMFSLMWLINFVCLICSPFERALYFLSSLLLKPFGVNSSDDEDEVTEEEIRFMVDMGSESGAIDPDEKEMIHNIFELDDTPIRDIMTHRTDVEFLWKDEDISVWEKTISSTNHSIYPVCGESVDDIAGIIKATDFYKLLRNSDNTDINSIIRVPYLVPESIKADDLFRQMQKNKNHFAIVLDEYGGLAGIATMSDLLEEIVGDLDNDAEAPAEDDIVQLDENTWKILGSTDIERVCETLCISLPLEEYNTFAGMILSELGEIPEDGSTVELEAYGLKIKVTKISEHRIDEAIVTKELIPETE